MRRSNPTIEGELIDDTVEAPSDVFVPARGIARGVLGGALVWVVVLILL